MADIEAAASEPAAPLKEWAWVARRVVAGAAAHLRELLAVTAQAVLLCFASAVSVNNADLIASSWACGLEGFPMVLVPALFVTLGLVFVLLFVAISVTVVVLVLLNFAVLLSLLWSRCRRATSNPKAAREIGGDGGALKMPDAQGRCSERTGAGDGDDGGFTVLAVFLFKAVALGFLLLLCAPANGYCGERVCSMLTDIRCLPYSIDAILRRLVELAVPTHR